MRIIKILLILFTIVFVSSFASGLNYYSKHSDVNKAIEPVNNMCFNACTEIFSNGCSEEVNALDFKSKMKQQCYRDWWDGCQECEEAKKRKLEPLEEDKNKFLQFYQYSVFTAFISGVISLISLISYFAIKFSVIRTMGAVSLIWLSVATIFAVEYNSDPTILILLFNSPVLLFWLYRFIRYGPSKMFKDK